jgi:hypothetical protein
MLDLLALSWLACFMTNTKSASRPFPAPSYPTPAPTAPGRREAPVRTRSRVFLAL